MHAIRACRRSNTKNLVFEPTAQRFGTSHWRVEDSEGPSLLSFHSLTGDLEQVRRADAFYWMLFDASGLLHRPILALVAITIQISEGSGSAATAEWAQRDLQHPHVC